MVMGSVRIATSPVRFAAQHERQPAAAQVGGRRIPMRYTPEPMSLRQVAATASGVIAVATLALVAVTPW